MEFLAFVTLHCVDSPHFPPRLTNLTLPHCLVTLHCVDSPHFLTSVRTRLASLPHLADDSPRLASSSPHPHCVLVSDWLVVLSPHRKPINTAPHSTLEEKQQSATGGRTLLVICLVFVL